MKIRQLIARTFGTGTRTETVSSSVSTVTWDPATDGTLILNVMDKCVVYLTITSSTTPYQTKLIVRYPDAAGHCALRWPTGTRFSTFHQQPCTTRYTQTTFDLNWGWAGDGILEVSDRKVQVTPGFSGDYWDEDLLAEYDIPSCFDTWIKTTENPNDATSGISCDFLEHGKMNGGLTSAINGIWVGVDSSTREYATTYDDGLDWSGGGTMAAAGTVTDMATSLLGTRIVAVLDTGGTNQARTFTGSAWGDFSNTFGGLAPNKVAWVGLVGSTGNWVVTFDSYSQAAYVPLNGGTWSYVNLWGGSTRTCAKLAVDYTTGEAIAIADSGNYVSYSSNYGVTWSSSSPGSLTEDPIDVTWIPAHRRWLIVGASGSLFARDTALGTSWTDLGVQIPSWPTQSIRAGSLQAIEDCVYYIDDTTTGPRVYYSIDGGVTWAGETRLNTLPNTGTLMKGSRFRRKFMWMRGGSLVSNDAYLSASSRKILLGV